MSIDVYRTVATSGRKVSMRSGIVAYERHDNPSLSILILYCLEVVTVWKEGAWSSLGVLILGLHQYDRAAVGDLGFGYDGTDVFDIAGTSVSFSR